MAETYEGIRDHSDIIPQDAREKWIKADQRERMLRNQYSKVVEEEDLTEDAKSRRAAEIYEHERGDIEQRKREAREALVQAARLAVRNSTPRPSGQSLFPTDASSVLMDQNESARIVRTVERRKDQKGPFSQSSSDYLKEEYKRGIEVGGVEGGAIVRGCLRAAGELGVDREELLNPLRNDRQREALDNSRRLEYFSDLISTKAPEPPPSLQQTVRRGSDMHSGRSPLAMAPASGPPLPPSDATQKKRASRKRRKNFS